MSGNRLPPTVDAGTAALSFLIEASDAGDETEGTATPAATQAIAQVGAGFAILRLADVLEHWLDKLDDRLLELTDEIGKLRKP